MAVNYGGVSEEDINRALKAVAESGDTDDISQPGQLGSALNQWQRPITDFGNEPQWVASRYIGEIDFGRREWARSRDTVDAVMDLLLKDLRARAAAHYKHLRIDSYIRQGSSRDGLKVIKPDEFDTLIEFHIEGLQLSEKRIFKNRKYVPGFCYLQVDQGREVLQNRYPELWQEGVFEEDTQGIIYLSSRMLHQAVFESLIDQSSLAIEEKVVAMACRQNINFHITRRMNPPAVNIRICFDDAANELFMRQGQIRNPSEVVREIDLDIVPAIRLRIDQTTHYNGNPVNAVVHAVCKWKEEDAAKSLEIANQKIVWHINSAGYERYTLDVARTNQKQRYILTALRLLKTYFTKTKTIAKNENRPPPPITTVLKSYHLKQIAFYLILYTCHINPIQIYSAKRALGCLLSLLRTTLQRKRLPHFFYSNSLIQRMFTYYPFQQDALRFDLFRGIPSESLHQAELSYEHHLLNDLGFTQNGDTELQNLVSGFSREIENGEYF
ncbi:uncharacterized protein LOC123545672 [Mercenaria mercenaria]|uniref:uncharacterized protein LOC123545672 n=1 Tax=Mercenaria mercenaria TaxID=6596 RepID=UPI00234E5310|nr:uncharacterized protein LOC123545672 [Mercenaria mercenaria]